MNRSLKRFARRIILVHLALFLGVIALVVGASHALYLSAHEQAQDESLKQLSLLANQTGSGLRGYYDGIVNDLELFKPHSPDSEESDALGADPMKLRPQRTMPPGSQRGRRGGPAPSQALPPQVRTLEDALPYQLNRRVSHLFIYPKDGSYTVSITLAEQAGKPDSQDIATGAHDWLENVEKSDVLSLKQVNGASGDSHGYSIIAVPVQGSTRDFLLVATVPVRPTAKRFFDDVNQSQDVSAFLLDEKMTVMAASASDQIGGAIDPTISAKITSLTSANNDSGASPVGTSFTIGTRTLVPSLVAVQQVNVLGKHWYVVLATPLAQVDGVVSNLFKRTLSWAIFVALSMTAILLSTAIQLIRTRVRAERERHELLEKEIRQAREIQLHWLPRPRAPDGVLDIATINQPASRISGDFYNWFELPDGRTAVVIGDVTGHGMAAAFLMATTQLLVRSTLPVTEDPGRCLEEINRQLCTQVFNGQFVTIQILILDPVTGLAQIATAGHPGPLIGTGESFKPLKLEPNLVLGVDRESTYATEEFHLAPHTTLLLYTDGVLDVESPTGSRFGIDRVRQSLYGQSAGAEEVIQAVVKQIDAFRGKIPLGDDLTMVAIQLQRAFAPNHPQTQGGVVVPVTFDAR